MVESVDLIAIDMPESAQLRLPELETSRLLAGTIFERRTDVSTKRNLALVLSHMLRWKRVVFLDDDIRVPDPADLSRAAGLLDTHTAVGLGIGGFPDNSMVCHAFREAGGWQETFIGGGALAVDVKRNRSFFPNVYNEDWFFVLDAGKGLQSVATVGQVLQYPYDPYRPERARAEEFGDVLAEGTFWLLDQGRSASDGDLAHWRDFLTKRKRFIERVHDNGRTVRAAIEPAERARMGRGAEGRPGPPRAYHSGTLRGLPAGPGSSTRNDGSVTSRPCGSNQNRGGNLRSSSLARRRREAVDVVHQELATDPWQRSARTARFRCGRSKRANFSPAIPSPPAAKCLACAPLPGGHCHCACVARPVPHMRRMRW